ncbi:(2Fe-2S)-binding protein [Sphingomonas sp. RB3P16]|uniref:(2Fe-2S)-binding protein n=1 Tax=Parasphingomonas frigoris TaxID=3096163 RepID=UPI002FC64D33
MTRFTVNNQPVQYKLDPQTPLLWALRDASNLTGTKYGCGTGDCGACTVDIDGEAVRSCQRTIGAIEGSYVTTIEGLSRDRTHPVQMAFLANSVTQCGFCIPGMIMATAVLLKKNRNPGEDEVRATLTNLCRCGIYPRLIEAVLLAAKIQRGEETVEAPPPPGVTSADAAREVPALTAPK